jgi:hypothetical protein
MGMGSRENLVTEWGERVVHGNDSTVVVAGHESVERAWQVMTDHVILTR